MQVAEDVGERKRVLRAERQQQRVFGGRRLQLEVELAAEPLAQRQAPRLVDAAAERRVQHELHAARLVEEALEAPAFPASAPRRASRVWLGEIRDGLLGRAAIDAGVAGQPGHDSRTSSCARATGASMSPRSRLTASTARRSAPALRRARTGSFGGAPFASATRIDAGATCSTRHDMLPS